MKLLPKGCFVCFVVVFSLDRDKIAQAVLIFVLLSARVTGVCCLLSFSVFLLIVTQW